MSITVVTDSTVALATGVAAAHVGTPQLTIVPLDVIVDGVSRTEGPEFGPREVALALRAKQKVTTSRPSSAAFEAAYRQAAEAGATGIVSVHLSGELSGTIDAARVAARDAPIPVEMVDTGSVGAGLGFAVATALTAAERGLELSEVAFLAKSRAERTSVIFYVDTLEYLRRGGRIGPGQALVGTALAVKPLLALEHGTIVPLDRVRTATRALHRLEELAVERTDGLASDLAVHHLDNARRAYGVADRLARRLGVEPRIPVTEVGAVLGAHVGPGVLGIVVSPR